MEKIFDNFRVNYKIWLDNSRDEGILGEGKIRLLKEIDKSGSLMAAAHKTGISYRKVWGDVKAAESLLGVRLIETHRGGESGGKTALTSDALRIIQAWEILHARIDEVLEKSIVQFKRSVKNK